MVKQIGIFRANITPIDRLIETSVGRQIMLDDLIEKLGSNAGKKGGQHYLFIGPRGIGKTHFLSLIENMVNADTELKKNYTIIRFPEENNRILSFADFLIGLIDILGEMADDNEWKKAYDELSENEKDEEIIDTIVPRLRNYQKKTGKTLLLLIENLDTLFTQQIKQEQDIHRFRSFLMDSPCATLVGTSPVYFPDLNNIKSPLYDFFDIQILEDLNEEQTLEMIRKNLEWEKRDDILKNFDAMIPKIRALHEMTGGNPRLIIMLYELISNDNILEVKMQFQKLLDQISPFYQDRMKELAPHERALLETIAFMRTEPRTPANIAKRLRKSPQQISSLLNRMTKAGYITVLENPDDKRSRFYKIKEGFFDLWLAMSKSRAQNKKLGYLVDFFEIWYKDRPLERERKREDLRYQMEDKNEDSLKKQNAFELLGYISEIGEPSERYQTKSELLFYKLKEGDTQNANQILKEIETISSEKPLFIWMNDQAHRWMAGTPNLDIQKWLDDMIKCWRTQRSGDLEKAVEIAHKLGNDLSGKGLHKVRIDLLTDSLDMSKDLKEKYKFNMEIAQSQEMDGSPSDALISLQNAMGICKEIGYRVGESITLNNIGGIYKRKGDHNKALKYYEDSLKICREIGDRSGEVVILNNFGSICHAKGDYDKALKHYEESLKIREEIGEKYGEDTTLNNIGQIYYEKGNYETALRYLENSLKINTDIGEKNEQSMVLNNIGRVYSAKSDYESALKYYENSLEISRKIGDKSIQIPALYNIAKMEQKKGNLKKMIAIEMEAYKLADEIDDAESIFYVGRDFGNVLVKGGQREEGIKILRRSYEIGRSASFPGTDKIRDMLLQLGEKIE